MVFSLLVDNVFSTGKSQIIQVKVEQQTWVRVCLEDVCVMLQGELTGLLVNGVEDESVRGSVSKLELLWLCLGGWLLQFLVGLVVLVVIGLAFGFVIEFVVVEVRGIVDGAVAEIEIKSGLLEGLSVGFGLNFVHKDNFDGSGD